MEEDIKIVEELLKKATPFNMSPSTYNAIENILNRLEEDEAVIKEMVKDKYKNIDMYEMANEIDYKLVDLFNGIPEEKGYEVIEQYFRKKVKDERNKV